MEGRPGTMVVAGALRFIGVLIAVGAVVGVSLFRNELLDLVPFVGTKGIATPVIFAVLVGAVGLLFWGIADALVMLAEHETAHERMQVAVADVAARVSRAPAAPPPSPKQAGPGDVPGFQRYQRPMPRVLKWTANVTNGPALLANPVCEIPKGGAVTAIGEVKEFAFVETPGGNGWLPKDSLADRLAGLLTPPPPAPAP